MNNSYWLFNTRLSVLVGHAENRCRRLFVEVMDHAGRAP
jgi:hypothetical protein